MHIAVLGTYTTSNTYLIYNLMYAHAHTYMRTHTHTCSWYERLDAWEVEFTHMYRFRWLYMYRCVGNMYLGQCVT